MRIFCKVEVYVYLGMEIHCKAGFLHSLLHSLCRHMPEAGCHIPRYRAWTTPPQDTEHNEYSPHSDQKKNEISQCIARLSKYHYSSSKAANNFLLLKVLSHFFFLTKCGRTYKTQKQIKQNWNKLKAYNHVAIKTNYIFLIWYVLNVLYRS